MASPKQKTQKKIETKPVKKVVKKVAKKTPPKKTVISKKESLKKSKTTGKKVLSRKSPTKKVASKSKGKSSAPSKKSVPKSYENTLNEVVSIDAGKTTASVKKRLSHPMYQRLSIENLDPIVVQIARVFGMFFIVAGGFASLLSFQFAGSTTPMLLPSAVVSSELAVTTEGETQINTSTISTTEEPDHEPLVHFEIPATAPLAEGVEISIEVPYAVNVRVFVHNRETGALKDIGNARFVAEDNWLIRWDTLGVDNGDYSLKALVENQYGTYDVLDSRLYEVFNLNNEHTSSVVFVPNDVEFPFEDGDVFVASLTFEVSASGYERMAVYAISKTTREQIRLSVIEEDSEAGIWSFFWDTKTVPNDEYQLKANVFIGQTMDTIIGPKILISNPTTNGAVTTQTSATDTLLEPTVLNTEASPEAVIDTVPVDGEEKEAVTEADTTKVELRTSSDSIVTGPITFEIKVLESEFVEVYYQGTQQSSRNFAGLANKVDKDKWVFVLDTRQLPNGGYSFYARAKRADQFVTSNSVLKSVNNTSTKTTLSPNTSTEITKIEAVVTDTVVNQQKITEFQFIESEDSLNTDLTQSYADKRSFELLLEFKEELDEEIVRFTSAVRSQDEGQIERAKERLLKLRQRISNAALSDQEAKDIIHVIDKKLEFEFAKIEMQVQVIEDIVRERTNESITIDSDQDGITDYDEIKIYFTDPNNPDTDNDGFLDGVEILNGFNANDPSPEAAVQYESPRESGIVRDDILSVDSIESVPEEGNRDDGVPAQALIKGKGLPNSFVSLYIFSTPIIVTIKTESDGSWAYRFDKELEDGTHQVYVGFTDNTGSVVAKSSPLSFVKKALAFTPVEAENVASVSPRSSSLASSTNILLVLTVAVVTIGLLLLLLGLYMEKRQINVKEKNETS